MPLLDQLSGTTTALPRAFDADADAADVGTHPEQPR